ncbi:MAG: PqqD family protein [Planctomycetota bacterium]|jgi:hypothetical protein
MSKFYSLVEKVLSYTPIGERKPDISREDSLKGVPVIREDLDSRENEKGERLLLIPRKHFYDFKFLMRFMPENPEPVKIILDELGNTVWKMIDGRRTVKVIAERFAEEKGIHRREAEASVVAFLSMLMKRGIITIVI